MDKRVKVTLDRPIIFEGVSRKPGSTILVPADHPLANPAKATKSATAKRSRKR